MSIKEWFVKNKVLIIGLLLAVAMPIYELVKQGGTSKETIIVTAAVALTSYLARNLRGQWQTIIGIVAVIVGKYAVELETGNAVNWWELLIGGAILFLTASTSPAKSIGYEKTAVISAAKGEGETIAPTAIPKNL